MIYIVSGVGFLWFTALNVIVVVVVAENDVVVDDNDDHNDNIVIVCCYACLHCNCGCCIAKILNFDDSILILYHRHQ